MIALFSKLLKKLRHEAASLRSAVVLAVLAGVTIPVGVTSYLDRQRLTEQFAEQLRTDLLNYSEVFAGGVRKALWDVSPADADAIIAAALADQRVIAIEVLNKRDERFAFRSRAGAESRYATTFAAAMQQDGRRIGTLIMTMDGADSLRRLDAALENDIRRVLQSLLGSLVLILLLLQVRLVRPIRRLVAASMALEKGDLSVPIARGRRDEIGQLARSMEATRQALGTVFGELEQRVALRTAALTAANTEMEVAYQVAETLRQEADAANNMKSEFLAMISHEVRTPLGGIIGMLRFGLRDTSLADGTRGKLTVGLSNAEILLQIINDILDYSKLAAGKLSLEVIDFDLPAVLRDARTLLEERAEAKGLSLVTELPADLPAWWRGDPVRLRQVLINLIGNSLKFTEKGEVRLKVTYESAEGMVVFAIRDTGIGISAEALPRMFGKFEQADAATSRKFGGTGLGLAICKLIVEAMGGSIGVESELGVGTTFSFRLPLQPGEATAAAADAATAVHSHHLNILCAEDGATNQIIIRELVQTMGHQIEIAEDGVKALAALAERDYDLVLMDSRMPNMDGLDALRRIRQGADGVRDATIPVVALTANVGVEERERFMTAGANGFLGKPIDEAALRAEIGRMIALLLERGKALSPRQDEPAAEEPGISALDAMFGIAEDAPESLPTTAVPASSKPQQGFSDKAKQAMRNAFLTEAPRLLAVIKQSVDANDAPAIALAAHSLKGSAGYFGAEELKALCGKIEAAADADDLPWVHSQLGPFETAVTEAVAHASKDTENV